MTPVRVRKSGFLWKASTGYWSISLVSSPGEKAWHCKWGLTKSQACKRAWKYREKREASRKRRTENRVKNDPNSKSWEDC